MPFESTFNLDANVKWVGQVTAIIVPLTKILMDGQIMILDVVIHAAEPIIA